MNLSFNRHLFFIVALVIFTGAVFGFSGTSVYADPHAVFYTVSGQQQLFFNMLAALDQADYVEPAKETVGLPAGASREKILEKRDKAGFGPEQDATLNATHTDLASVLTRGVTLEGNDVWSSYLVLQFALESARRQNSAKLIEIFCQRGLGLKECKENNEPAAIAEARKEQSYENNPRTVWDRIIEATKGALYAGLGIDQAKRRDKLSEDNLDANKGLPYNASIAALQDSVSSDSVKQAIVMRWIANTLNPSSSDVNSDVLSNISFDTNGRATLAFNSTSRGSGSASLSAAGASLGNGSGSREATLDDYYRKFSSVVAAPAQLFGAATTAQEKQATVDSIKTVNGIKAPTYPVPEGAARGRIGAINEIVRSPAAAELAQLNSAVDTVSKVSASAYTADAQVNIPGTTETLEEVEGGGNGKVDGISSDQLQKSSGKVLGETDTVTKDGVSQQVNSDIPTQPKVRLNSDPVFFGGEPPVLAFIRALGGGENEGGCGCSVDDVANTYGNDFLTN